MCVPELVIVAPVLLPSGPITAMPIGASGGSLRRTRLVTSPARAVNEWKRCPPSLGIEPLANVPHASSGKRGHTAPPSSVPTTLSS